jgi:trehalose 6-phosphate phosphatase
MDARPSQRIIGVISRLAGSPKTQVTIVSGRDITSLLELFKGFDHSILNWSGAHGMQIRFRGTSKVQSGGTLPCIASLKDEISMLTGQYPCFILEDKGLSFALHYRKCPGKMLHLLKKAEKIIARYQEENPIEVMQMKKVIEVKPKGINKGNTIHAILSRHGDPGDFLNICMGDDVTDEYLFQANPEGINIKVGDPRGPETSAGYYLKGVSDVYWFLKEVSRLRNGSLS